MKPRPSIGMVAMGLLTTVVLRTELSAQQLPQYNVTFLGNLGGCCGEALGINNAGDVTGFSSPPDLTTHAYLWRSGVMTDLGTLGGLNSNGEFGVLEGPNERGQVVGGSETSTPDPLGEDFCFYGNFLTCSAFVWSDGVMTALPTLGGNNGTAADINNRGQIVGAAENTTPDATCAGLPPPLNQIDQIQAKAVIWENGAIRELPIPSADPDAEATSINDSGQIAGGSGNCGKGPEYALHALLWDNGGVTDLGNLGGTLYTFAEHINNRGQIVGASDLPGDATFHAFLWTRDSGMQDLGTVNGDFSSFGSGINDKGQVVGTSCPAADDPCHGFVWQNGVMTDLNTLLPAGGSTYVFAAVAINSRGQITLGAYDASTGNCCMFLATPTGDGAGKAATAGGSSSRRSNMELPESARKLLNRGSRHRAPVQSGSN